MVVLLVIAAIIGALQMYFFSRNVYRQTARSAFGTVAEYLAESACEEGFHKLQTEANQPDTELYKIFRQDQQTLDSIDVDFVPRRLFERMTSPENSESFEPFPVDRIACGMTVRFSKDPIHPMEPLERTGEVTISAVVQPTWGRGEQTYRRVEVRKPFRIQLITPPQTFDRRAMTLFKPDYINGTSKQALDQDIVQPTNKAVDDVNRLNKGYDDIIKRGKQMVKWTDCQGTVQYVGGSPAFIKATIPGGAKIPPNFFWNDSIVIGNPDRNPLEKLEDFNYEHILRELYPPLKQTYDVLYNVSNINLQVLNVTVPLLAATIDKPTAEGLATPTFGASLAFIPIHTLLETLVSIQCVVGQVSVFGLKVLLEGVIIGQHTDALRQAAKGNFTPVLDGIQTSVGDIQSSGVLNDMGSSGQGMQNVGDTAQASSADLQGASSAMQGSQAAGQATGDAAGQAAGNAAGNASADGAGQAAGSAAGQGASEETRNISQGQASQFEGLAGNFQNQMTGAGGAGNFDKTLGFIKGAFGKGELSKAGPLDQMGTDSNTAMLTGLIKGFVKGHRDYYSTEFPRGGNQYDYYRNEATKFYLEFYRRRASFVFRGQEDWDAFVERHREGRINGVFLVDNRGAGPDAAPLAIKLDGFQGKAVLYATGDVDVQSATLADSTVDTLTLVTPGNITLPSSRVEAALAAVPESDAEPGEGGAVIFSGPADIFGSLFVRRYTVADNDRTGQNSVKGKLEFNPMLPAVEGDQYRLSHLWVTFSPVERHREVFLK